MIDVLLCFPDYNVAADVGVSLGFTSQNQDGTYKTTQATETLAICVIGEHYYPNGELFENEDGTGIPVLIGDGNWWVMVRSLVEMPIPEQIEQFIIEPDPENNLIPNIRWA